MNTIKKNYLLVFCIALMVFIAGCKKDTQGSLYTPTAADATSNATLQELQQGRDLYISNCNNCHGLYSPDDYNPSQWRNILGQMAPRTNLSSAEIQLVTKYVCRGKQ